MEEVDETTPASAVLHRPQQAFSQDDIGLAWQLGERVVLSQLDLIAYRNGDYFPNAGASEDYRRASRHGMIAAERVLVLSEHTRNELIAQALVDAERIKAIPPGLDHRPAVSPAGRTLAGAAEDEGGSGIEPAPGFLLCLGADYRHRTGCSRCACSPPCASVTVGGGRSCSPAHMCGTAPRERRSAMSWKPIRSCPRP